MRTIACETCGAQVSSAGNRLRYCPECSRQRQKRQSKQYQERQKALKHPCHGTIFQCPMCGTPTTRNTASQKRCAKCTHEVALVKTRDWRNRVGPRKRSKFPIGSDFTCRICSVEFKKTATYQLYCADCLPLASRHRHKTPWRRVRQNMSSRLRAALKGEKAGPSWEKYFSFSIDDLMRHLERQFEKGMNWENYGQWHIDHIVPVRAFSRLVEREAIERCWALHNLRPLWAQDNRKKSGKHLHLV